MFKRTSLAALALLALTTSPSWAAESKAKAPTAAATAAAKTPIPPVLQSAMKNGGLTVFKDFPAAGGLQGWVVKDSNSGKHIVVYTTPDGQVLLAGMAMDSAGKNLTQAYAEEHVPLPDFSPAFKDFSTEGPSAGVTVGNAKAPAEIIVVFDANCTYCKLMHRLVEPAVAAGELRVRYVPVAILGSDSLPKGTALLASKDPGALVESFANGGRGEQSYDTALQAKVKANTELMKRHGFNGTPVVLYKSRAGGDESLQVSNGVPSVLNMFNKLGISGQVEQLKKDPKLAEYLR